MIKKKIIIVLVALIVGTACSTSGELTKQIEPEARALVIAHRGSSGYLPEHTLAAKAMAYAQGADYIEQDLVMTKDDRLVVLHDRHLDTVTNVAQLFPDRARDDGRYYVIDFTLNEIRQLSVSERFETKGGEETAVFVDRFPLWKSSFRVNTFEEEIELVQGLNQSTGQLVGIYPEIKSPAFHLAEGKDIAVATLAVLKRYGYTEISDPVFLQCFDAAELQRIDATLMPEMDMQIPLVQLMDTSRQYDWMLRDDGMQRVAAYAEGVGPSVRLLIAPDSVPEDIKFTALVENAHAAGLAVHPYTFRRERDQMPPFSKDYNDFLRLFVEGAGVDGVFTDFPDLTVEYLELHK